MMRRLPFLILIAFLQTYSPGMAETPKYQTDTEVDRDEKWWGLFVGDAPAQPFLQPFQFNTGEWPQTGFRTPIMLSSRGRYVWSNHPITVDFTEQKLSIGSDYEEIEAQKGGRTLREAYLVCCHKNFPPTGKVPAIDLFTLPVYDTETEFGFMQNQQELLAYAERLLQEGFPKGILLVSDGWRSTSREYDFDRAFYPKPKEMIERLHEMGFKVMLTITPYASSFGRTYISDLKQGWFIRNAEKKPMILENEGGYSVCYDITQADQAALIRNSLNRLQEQYGVDGFRFDCRAAVAALHTDGRAGQFMQAWVGLGEGISLCEYEPGLNKPLTHYVNCTENHDTYDWQTLRESINDMIVAGLCGFSYYHISSPRSDVSQLPDDQLLLASALQLDLLMPVANIEFAPWRITDPTLYLAVKETANFRASLAEYLRETVMESVQTAEPLIRHMEYQFPRNGFADCNTQFMLGAKYLVVPNTGHETKRLVRLPRGVWTDRHGNRYKGPLVTEVNCSDGQIVWFELETK